MQFITTLNRETSGTRDFSDSVRRLEPFFISAKHRALMDCALEIAVGASGRPNDDAIKEAFLSCTFDFFCAPPHVTAPQHALSLRFLDIFFKADDAPQKVLEELADWMYSPQGLPASLLASRCDSLLCDLHQAGCHVDLFKDALRLMCLSMRDEREMDKSSMTEEQFHHLRRHTVAVPSYTEIWRSILGLKPSEGLHAALQRAGVAFAACQLVYIVNDLGSFERDVKNARNPELADSNFVLMLARDLPSEEAGIDEAIRRHNKIVHDFQSAERQLLGSKHGKDPCLLGYLEILRCTINGNLAATRHLVPMRYPNSEKRLAALFDV